MLKWIKRIFLFCIITGVLGVAGITVIYFQVKGDLPSVDKIKETKLQIPMKIYSADNELISQFGEKRRIPLESKDVPDFVKEAFIATEDSRFYSHFGIDPIGIARAVMVVATTGHLRQGASTITQQVAKNIYLTREKTFTRKIKEMILAIQIEKVLTKDEILMLYLNKIALGQRSYGIGAAAQVYYGKKVKDLTLAEAAMLAGLPKAPSRYNPVTSKARGNTEAKNRRHIVLLRMLDEEYITRAEFDDANNMPITGKKHGAQLTLSAHYVAEMARKQTFQLCKDGALNAGLKLPEGKNCDTAELFHNGITIYTTINKRAQEAANKAVVANLHAYDQRHGYRGTKIVLWTPPEPALSNDEIIKKLHDTAAFSDLIPAVVVKVDKQSVDVIVKGKKDQIQTIPWDGLKWAREFKSDTRQGPAPKRANQILKEGQQIFVSLVDKLDKKGKRIEKAIAEEASVEEVAISEDPSLTTSIKKEVYPFEQIYHLSQFPEASAAFVSISPKDGAIQALVGGFSFIQSKYNRATQAKRQIGSNIKPFVYSAAIDSGYTLATLVNDTPINEGDWRPKNSPNTYVGPIRLRQGLGQSKNVISVRLVQDIGVAKVISQLAKFGFPTDNIDKYSLTIALGSAAFTPLEVVSGFAVINNGGYKVTPYVIDRIEGVDGEIIYKADPAKAPRVLSVETAFLTRQLLESAIWGEAEWKHSTGWNGTGWRAGRALKRHDMGGKTGTTNDSKDAWFSGFVGNVVATSWVGFDDFNRNLGRTSRNDNLPKTQHTGGEFGGSTALPAWNTYMQKVALDQPEIRPRRPRSISMSRIDRATGLLTHKSDYTTRMEYFKSGTQPTEYADPEDVFYEEPNPSKNGKNTEEPGPISEDDIF
ncbi:MAG TPA: penicillin-binding protein 1A [Leucothrix mucor]|nr:penicillin-binding protein 1A [Leucothrix mucor]